MRIRRDSRGLLRPAPIKTTRGGSVSVYQSSADGRDHVWLCVQVGDVAHGIAPTRSYAHMSLEQAERVANTLLELVRQVRQ